MFSGKIEEIKSDRSSGASQIARNALNVLKSFVQTNKSKNCTIFITEFTELGTQLFEARPEMAPVQNLVAQIVYEVNSLKAHNLGLIRSFALSKIDDLLQKSESAVNESAHIAADLIANFGYVCTCSYSSTICEVFKTAKNQGKHFKVFVAESKTADNQFSYGKDLATFLESIDVPVQVFPDTAISIFVPKTNIVFVGADRVLSDGSIINGTPTHAVAVNAEISSVPFYCVCETAKINALNHLGQKFELAEGFDVVSSKLLTGIITENGILKSDTLIKLVQDKMRFSKFFSIT